MKAACLPPASFEDDAKEPDFLARLNAKVPDEPRKDSSEESDGKEPDFLARLNAKVPEPKKDSPKHPQAVRTLKALVYNSLQERLISLCENNQFAPYDAICAPGIISRIQDFSLRL